MINNEEIRNPFHESDLWVSPWIKGSIYIKNHSLLDDDIHYEVKVYDKPYKYGLYGGKIWKLYIYWARFQGNGNSYKHIKDIASWDTFWVTKPETDIEKTATNMIINMYN